MTKIFANFWTCGLAMQYYPLSTTHEMTQEAMPFSLQSITVSPTHFNMHQAALFLLKAKECLKVSQTALNALISDIDTLLHLQLEAAKDSFKFAIQSPDS